MHAFLLIGNNTTSLEQSINSLAKKLHAKVLNFPISKIEDTRNLNNLIRLSFQEPTLIVSQNIQEATDEALNAFLKNLEEPQENIYFALTSPSIRKVLPTIVSRCQVIKITNDKLQITNEGEDIEKFLKLTTGEKLNYIDKIKDRNDAIDLAERTVNFLHSQLHLRDVKYTAIAKNIEVAQKTLSGLKRNGNVNLQLVDFVINFKNG